MNFRPRDPNFAARIKQSFERQTAMGLIGATLERIEPGRIEIHMPSRDDLNQQHGYVHGGITVMIADSASGFAAMTLVDADTTVLSVQHSTQFIAPAIGEKFEAHGHVVKSGKTLTIAEADVYAIRDGHRHLCVRLSQTIINMRDTPEKER